ncbi:MAG: hypothetical protein FKY71_12495 [Spiribacter salinus]|uniref:HTH HARE-type domain-containing protein n=1 Tax=Spiribacter salinus TaxID=1335746 RepID=A0A540VRA3_9GAMM|nr:MAG: hypothetical protein FKY71_12495 [Spiribacter salinus]
MTTAKKAPAKKTATKARTGATRGRKTKTGASAPTAEKQATEAHRPPLMAEEKTKVRKPSLLDAAIEVMKRQSEPLGAKDITVTVLNLGLWSGKGKTPEATLYSAMIREIANKGEQARFKKASRGRFELTEVGMED